jgi:hypothetical protein
MLRHGNAEARLSRQSRPHFIAIGSAWRNLAFGITLHQCSPYVNLRMRVAYYRTGQTFPPSSDELLNMLTE